MPINSQNQGVNGSQIQMLQALRDVGMNLQGIRQVLTQISATLSRMEIKRK